MCFNICIFIKTKMYKGKRTYITYSFLMANVIISTDNVFMERTLFYVDVCCKRGMCQWYTMILVPNLFMFCLLAIVGILQNSRVYVGCRHVYYARARWHDALVTSRDRFVLPGMIVSPVVLPAYRRNYWDICEYFIIIPDVSYLRISLCATGLWTFTKI